MSKKSNKQTPARRSTDWLVFLAIAVVVTVIAVVLLRERFAPVQTAAKTQPVRQTTEAAEDTQIRIDEVRDNSILLPDGLVISDVGSYTGAYMEDGSDDVVSGVLMIVVTNEGDRPLQYAKITMQAGEGTAVFSVTTLPVGASAVVLEASRLGYDRSVEYAGAAVEQAAWFDGELSLCEDRLQLQQLDGALNVTNISGGDLEGDIVIYYKNSSADMFYGGITYRIRLSGGLPSGATRQVMADHFSERGSTVVFVTCG